MKKVFAVIAIAGVMTACNNNGEKKDALKDSIDHMMDKMDKMFDSAKEAMDQWADSAKGTMEKTADSATKKLEEMKPKM